MKHDEASALPPRLALDVPDLSDESVQLSVILAINEADASSWQRPIGLFIAPYGVDYDSEDGTGVHLTRHEARLLRDFLASLLEAPDWRQDA